MNLSLDISFNCNKHNITSVSDIFSNLLKNIDFVNSYEDYEYDIINKKIQRTSKICTFIFKTSNEFNGEEYKEFWNFVKNIKKIRGIFIESILDLNSNKLLFSSTYYKKFIANKKYERKNSRSFSETDAKILDEFLKKINN